MRKIVVEVEEKLTYKREIEFIVPDGMDDAEIQDILEDASSGDAYLSDFVYNLKRKGLNCHHAYDDSLDSPYTNEIEVWDFWDVKKEEIA